MKRLLDEWFSGGDLAAWHYHHTLPFRPVLGLNGERLRGLVMRRRVESEWQYRPLTATEELERQDLGVV